MQQLTHYRHGPTVSELLRLRLPSLTERPTDYRFGLADQITFNSNIRTFEEHFFDVQRKIRPPNAAFFGHLMDIRCTRKKNQSTFEVEYIDRGFSSQNCRMLEAGKQI